MTTIKDTLAQLRGEQAEQAFRRLYRSFPRVRSFLRKMGANRQQCEDIFQEALMVLYRKAQQEGFTLSSAPEAYLLTTCKYLWLKQHKLNGSLTELPDDIPAELLSAGEEDDKKKLALAALKKLGQRCQDLLISFYVLKSSMKEISERFGYSSDKVAKNQKYKCLEYARNLYRSTN